MGFLGRSHIYHFGDKRWSYSYAIKDCKFSMILTGCTFVHKVYILPSIEMYIPFGHIML